MNCCRICLLPCTASVCAECIDVAVARAFQRGFAAGMRASVAAAVQSEGEEIARDEGWEGAPC